MSEDGNNYVGKAKQFYDKYQRNGGAAKNLVYQKK
jgi:hypothetical protein